MKVEQVSYIGEDEEGLEKTIVLPSKYAVCERCRGTGVHDNPAFSNGLSAEDFAEDEEFADNYFAGRYDVTCEECHGNRVIPVIDEERCTAEQLAAFKEHCNNEASYRAEIEAERRMGA